MYLAAWNGEVGKVLKLLHEGAVRLGPPPAARRRPGARALMQTSVASHGVVHTSWH